MDRSIYTALNSMNILRDNQSVTAQNLANISVTGFQKDIQINFSSVYLDRDKGIDPRVLALQEPGGYDSTPGPMQQTGAPLDLACRWRQSDAKETRYRKCNLSQAARSSSPRSRRPVLRGPAPAAGRPATTSRTVEHTGCSHTRYLIPPPWLPPRGSSVLSPSSHSQGLLD